MDIYLYSGTHWDREWYQTFQGFRYRLVKMAQRLIDGLENDSDFGVFHFDGQTIVLEDILEICPELRPRLEKLISSGKLIVGPWYCMPDEFLLSGESLISNLKRGGNIAREFGGQPLHSGFICDIFGHIAQTPQIFAEMSINSAVLGRGTNEHTTPMYFRWRAPDGTEVTTFKLCDADGYTDFSTQVFRTNAPFTDAPDEEIKNRTVAYVGELKSRANIPVILTLDSCDHNNYHSQTGHFLDIMREVFPEDSVYHVSLEDMFANADKYIDDMPVKTGELNETAKRAHVGYLHLITNTLSSRFPIKSANDKMQTRLEKWASPFYAFSQIDAPVGYLTLATKYLLQNHPHDSICGCSIDQVHRDMMYRFDQVREITDELIDDFSGRLRSGPAGGYDPVSNNGAPKVIRIYNPLPYSYNRVIEASVEFEKNFPATYAEPFGYEKINSFRIYDHDGNEIPYGISDIRVEGGVDRYSLVFPAALSAASVTEFNVRPSSMPSRYPARMEQCANSVDNGLIQLYINTDGTVDITDHSTGRYYCDLLQLIDDGEIGDGWYHANPATDRVITSTDADIEISENNANRTVFKVTRRMRLPEQISFADFGIRRSSDYTTITVTHFISLARGDRFVTVKTLIDNTARDHRLRLRMPTEIVGDKYSANQPFCFVTRNTDATPGTDDWKEYGVIEKQTAGIVVKRNTEDEEGFAFISAYGLHECAVSNDGNIDITLLRCFRKAVGTHGEPDGQLIGTHEFSFILAPIDNSVTDADLQRAQDILQAGTLTVTSAADSICSYRPVFKIDGDSFIFTGAAKTEDGGEIRLFNCSDDTSSATLLLPEGVTEAYLTHIDGRRISYLKISEGAVGITAGAWKIVTVGFTR